MAQPARPEVLSFLAAVKDNPDELLSRRVLADWLDPKQASPLRLCGRTVALTLKSIGTCGKWQEGKLARSPKCAKDFK